MADLEGAARQRYAEARGLRRADGSKATAANHGLAYAAECLVADTYGLPHPRIKGVDKGWDFAVGPRGILRIDVKWTAKPYGPLNASITKKGLRANVYVQVAGATPAEFRITGWAWRHELRMAPKPDVGHGPFYSLPQAKLRPSVDLLLATAGLQVAEPMA